MLWGGRMLYTTKRVQIFLAHISGHNHNWLLHWFVPCYLQNHALLWQDNWMRFNVEMHSNSWCVCWWEDRTVSFQIFISLHLWYWNRILQNIQCLCLHVDFYKLLYLLKVNTRYNKGWQKEKNFCRECQWFIRVNDTV